MWFLRLPSSGLVPMQMTCKKSPRKAPCRLPHSDAKGSPLLVKVRPSHPGNCGPPRRDQGNWLEIGKRGDFSASPGDSHNDTIFPESAGIAAGAAATSSFETPDSDARYVPDIAAGQCDYPESAFRSAACESLLRWPIFKGLISEGRLASNPSSWTPTPTSTAHTQKMLSPVSTA